MKRIAISLSYLLLIVHFAQGQQSEALKNADGHFEFESYQKALNLYQEVLEEEEEVPERVRLRIAECHRQLKDYQTARDRFQALHEDGKLTGESLLNYGHILRNMRNYEEAMDLYQEFADENPDDPRGYYYKESAEWAKDNKAKNPAYEIEELSLETGGFSLGQCPYEGGLLFSTPKRVQGSHGEILTYDLVHTRDNNGSFGEPKKIEGNVNNTAHQGTPCVIEGEDGDILYYTSNVSEKVADVNVRKKEKYGLGEESINRYRIEVAEKNGGKWERREKPPINKKEYNITHPYVTSDEDSLFFVSNQPGGEGGFDIYLSTMTDTGWGEPENLGDKINTLEHEMYPYWHEGTLYFSSYGHFNFGGSDIFKCEYDREKDQWGSVENMGRPLNSSKDDFAFVLTSDPDSGFFSSNRDSKAGKDRIFSYINLQLPDTIRGVARNRINSQPIEGVTVTLFEKKGEEEERASKQTTNETGKCKLILEQETPYRLLFEKEGYESKDYDIPEDKREDVIALLESIELDPTPEKDKIIELDNIYFDYGKAELRAEGKETLDKLKGYMEDFPEVRVELSAHTDAQSSASFNMKLSKRRAQSCYDYLKEKGLDADRVKPKGYGETQLVNECSDGVECPDEKHQENRRVEIKFLEKPGS